MTIDFYSSEPHYLDHLAPTWLALDPTARGHFHTITRCAQQAAWWGIGRTELRLGRPQARSKSLVVVASHRDLRACLGRPIILSEHGAGQSYGDDHPAYAGGDDRRDVVLFLCPNEAVAARNRLRWPAADVAVISCPKLDRWTDPDAEDRPARRSDSACVAFSWHWDYASVPEGRTAFPWFADAVADLARRNPHGWRLIGHSHPRSWRSMRRWYEAHGIEPVPDFEAVLDRADMYVCDNSSTIFEAAAVGIPVVLLNAPWYRRDVEHGLRFWSHADVGLQVDEPGDLAATIEAALADPPEVRASRDRVVAEVYGELDGHAADRAARVIEAAAQREEESCRTRRAHAVA